MTKKNKRFFISHSSKDEKLVQLFVDDILVTGLKIDDDEIYCSSIKGLGNKSGQDFVDEIRKALEFAEISILIITENYKASEICLNEMGAAWLSKSHVIPIIVEPITFQSVGALNAQKHCEKIFNDDSLYNIRQTIEEHTAIEPTKANRWKGIVEKFLDSSKHIKHTKPQTISVEDYKKLQNEKEELDEEFKEISNDLDIKNKYIKKLEAKKDKVAIKAAKKESGMISVEKEFEENINEVKKALTKFNNITQRILLCNFYQMDHPNFDGYWDDIKDSQRKKFLTDECQSGSKSANETLDIALQDLGRLESNNELCDWYEEEHGESFDPADEEFWEKFY